MENVKAKLKTEELFTRLCECNNINLSRLNALESKLNKLLDKSEPQKTPETHKDQPTIDFYHSTSIELDYYEQHNKHLQRLIEHLGELI